MIPTLFRWVDGSFDCGDGCTLCVERTGAGWVWTTIGTLRNQRDLWPTEAEAKSAAHDWAWTNRHPVSPPPTLANVGERWECWLADKVRTGTIVDVAGVAGWCDDKDVRKGFPASCDQESPVWPGILWRPLPTTKEQSAHVRRDEVVGEALSGRPRTRVICETCAVQVHPATTGPDAMWAQHVNGGSAHEEPMAVAVERSTTKHYPKEAPPEGVWLEAVTDCPHTSGGPHKVRYRGKILDGKTGVRLDGLTWDPDISHVCLGKTAPPYDPATVGRWDGDGWTVVEQAADTNPLEQEAARLRERVATLTAQVSCAEQEIKSRITERANLWTPAQVARALRALAGKTTDESECIALTEAALAFALGEVDRG